MTTCDYCEKEMKPNALGYRNYFRAGAQHVHAHCYEIRWNEATATCNEPNCEYRRAAIALATGQQVTA